jgi:PAS domain S-box-containing protein
MRRVTRQVLSTSLVYLVVASAWILLSDWLLTLAAVDPEQIQRLQSYKGLGFVVITTLLLAWLLYLHLSERQAIELELQAQKRSYETLVGNLPGIVYRCRINRDWTMEFISDAALTITGYPPAELERDRTVSYGDLILPEHRDDVWNTVQACISRGVPFQLHYRIRRRDGVIRWVWEQGRQVTSPDGEPLLEGVILDVTERHEQEQELRRRLDEISRLNEEMRAILDNAPVMAVFSGPPPQHCLRWANRCWENTFGWSLEEARHRPILEDLYPDAEDRKRALEFIDRAERKWGIFRVRCRDGRWLDCEWINIPLSDGSVISIGRDITEQKRLEERIQVSQRLESLARLAGGVAHDFKNMLTVVLTRTQSAQSELDPDNPAQPALEEILSAAMRAAELADRLLVFGRKQPVEPRIVELNRLVRGMQSLLNSLLREDIRTVLDLASEPGFVRADPTQLEQVVLNLAVNARDAMPGGGILTIRTRGRNFTESPSPVLPPGQYVLLEVEDTGTGISPDHLPRIFEPLFTTKAAGQSIGLGLPTVYGIARTAGGDVLVDSEPGRGTCFTVLLPRCSAPAAPAPEPARTGPMTGKETILLVEDEPVLRRTVERLLSRLGYKVLTAADGTEAMRLVAENGSDAIDLLLTDVVMPGIKGTELARRLRADHPGLKVLFMTGYSDDLLRGEAREGIPVIPKPFQRDELARRLRELLDAAPLQGNSP